MTIAPAERVETSLEEIAALDFEFSPHCERHEASGVTVAAAWYVHRSCACRINTLCHECKVQCELMVVLGGFQCRHCEVDPIKVRFEPIKAKR